MIYYIQIILIVLLITSTFGYIFATLKEKIYLKNDIIVIDSKAITEEDLRSADMKEFVLDGNKMKSGDEIKLITKEKRKYNGILIGAQKIEKKVMIITHKDEIKSFNIDNIFKLKVISKYGKFF